MSIEECPMRITVFGASGGTGRQFIDLALERGHSIRAVYRTAPAAPPVGQVEILVHADVFERDFVAQAVRGADVVIAAMGPNFVERHNAMSRMISAPDIHQRLARTLVSVLQASGAPARIIAISTGSMGPGDAAMGLAPRLLFRFFRTVVARNLKAVGRDLAAMERELAGSGLDWYAVRPIKLTDGPLTRQVVATERFTMRDISRADVAWYMLALAEDPATRHRTPMLVSGLERRAGRSEANLARGRAS
jgi:uncharacterized protein YbjT (DUF2867 family)